MLKSSGTDKAVSATSKKIPKPASTNGVTAKPKPAKVSLTPLKLPLVEAAKSGKKPKSGCELSTEKAPPKPTKASTAALSIVSESKKLNGKKAEYKTDLGPVEGSDHVEQKDGTQPTQQAVETPPPLENSPQQILHKSEPDSGINASPEDEGSITPTADNIHHVKFSEDSFKQTNETKVKPFQSGGISGGQAVNVRSPKEHPVSTPCSARSTDTPLEDSWRGVNHQVSPQSETGSTHTTSSDDIKPRSEDYDAGGSQDDDCSNDRGVSKCGTMLCHDFLGHSSSDTSTPEELKMYECGAGLRVEVRLRSKEAETTSEEEGGQRRPPSWLQREEVPMKEYKEDEVPATRTSVPDHQPLSSEEEDDDDEEETEDERSEVEVIPGEASLQPAEPSPLFQGIINLAFDDGADQEDDYQPSNFHRSVLLSVDECEELVSEEGGAQTPPPQQPDGAVTPCDVFECDSPTPPVSSSDKQDHLPRPLHAIDPKHNTLKEELKEQSVFLTEIHDPAQESNHIQADEVNSDSRDQPLLERPSHLDLRHTEHYNGAMNKTHPEPSESKKVDLHLDLNEPQRTGGSPVPATQSPSGNV